MKGLLLLAPPVAVTAPKDRQSGSRSKSGARQRARKPDLSGIAWAAAIAAAILIGVANSPAAPPAPPANKLELKASAFQPGGTIPERYTCSGDNISPALRWTDPPQGTQAFALIVTDPDAPAHTWVHWVVYNLPPASRRLPEAVSKSAEISGGGLQGSNDFRDVGYGGPCPPPGKAHRYFFRLYALNSRLSLRPGATRVEVERAMRSHVLAEAELMGRYGR